MRLRKMINRILKPRRGPVLLELKRPTPPSAVKPEPEEWQKRIKRIEAHVAASTQRTRLRYLGRPLDPEEEAHV